MSRVTTSGEVTRLLEAVNRGDEDAREALVRTVYQELRQLAGIYMGAERPGHTLQPTALVNEAWMKLTDQSRVQWQGRSHFFGIAAQAMRRILVDHHRRRTAKRRSADPAITLAESVAQGFDDPVDLMALDGALQELSAMDARAARIVELRFFGGLSVEETAEVLGVSTPTVKRDWRMARAWLYERLGGEDSGEASR